MDDPFTLGKKNEKKSMGGKAALECFSGPVCVADGINTVLHHV